MDRVIEFSINHWPMVLSFVVLLFLAIRMETNRAGPALTTHELTLKVNSEDAKVLDLREAKDFKEGHIVDAINVPLAKLDSEIKSLEKMKDKPMIIVCQHGQSAGQAVKKLEAAGFENLFRLAGGMTGWRSENLPVVKGS